MTDLEITKLCAEAMGYRIVYPDQIDLPLCVESSHGSSVYYPLHDDAQAMALVKIFKLFVNWDNGTCWVMCAESDCDSDDHTDLNRAVCECVARMQAAKMHPSEDV